MFLQRAMELKDKGNLHFGKGEHVQALACYAQALRVAPEGHPDRAMFHSNRAACYLQQHSYNEAIHECNQALAVSPGFSTHPIRSPHVRRWIMMLPRCVEAAAARADVCCVSVC
jgi:tetratricopeptide (TPR) repeat protein